MSSVIYYWTEAWQHGIYLFYIIKKETTTDKAFVVSESFTITQKPVFAHFGKHEVKQSHWLLCVAKNCDWSRNITPLSNLTWKSLLVDKNLQWKQKSTAKTAYLKENARKVKSVFVTITALWAKKLGCCLEYCRSWKIMPGKLAVELWPTLQRAIRFEF